MPKSKSKVIREKDESNVSGGEPLVKGRGGMGPENTELPSDQGSRAQRGRAEDEQEPMVVKEDDRPRRGRRRPYVSKGLKTNEQIKHMSVKRQKKQ